MHRPALNQHFLTAALADEGSMAFTEYADVLQLAFRACRERYPFSLTAGVILPDHLHCIIALPAGDTAGAARWRLLQGLLERVVGGGPDTWRAFEDRALLGAAELQKQIDYVHFDPVRHGLVRSPEKWQFTSLHAYVEHGLRPRHWPGDAQWRDGARGAATACRPVV